MLARGAELVSRWWWPIEGPFTSVLVSDNGSVSSVPVTARTASAIGAVFRSLAIYADLIGTMPVRRYRGEWTVLPAPPFVERPAGLPIGWTDEIGQTVASLLLRGNAYLIPTTLDSTGYPETFYVANPDGMRVTRLEPRVLEYRLRLDSTASSSGDLVWINPAPDEVLHLRWQTPPGSFLGVGILDAQGGPAGLLAGAASTERYAADLMSNPVPPAILEHPLRLDKTQATDLQTQWIESVARARAVPAVLSGGIKYSPLTLTANDVQLIESRKWNATAIATVFGLPPYMVGGDLGSSLTYSTVEGENSRLWTDALEPMAVRLQRGIGGAWTPAGQRIKFVPDAILRSQTLDRYNAHKIALDSGFMTLDEVRALEDLPPLEVELDPTAAGAGAPAPAALPPAPAALTPGGAP